jgi:hypothetical protein
MFKKRAQVLQKRIHTELEYPVLEDEVDLVESIATEATKKK